MGKAKKSARKDWPAREGERIKATSRDPSYRLCVSKSDLLCWIKCTRGLFARKGEENEIVCGESPPSFIHPPVLFFFPLFTQLRFHHFRRQLDRQWKLVRLVSLSTALFRGSILNWRYHCWLTYQLHLYLTRSSDRIRRLWIERIIDISLIIINYLRWNEKADWKWTYRNKNFTEIFKRIVKTVLIIWIFLILFK